MASRETILDVLAKLEECKETLNNSLNYGWFFLYILIFNSESQKNDVHFFKLKN